MNAKACTKCGIEKSADRFTADKRRKSGLQAHCKDCVNAYHKEYAKSPRRKEWQREYSRNYVPRDPERARAAKELWLAANREKVAAAKRRYYERNREKVIEAARLSEKRNAASAVAKCARRRATKAKATPVWADAVKIKDVYVQAKRLTAETGVLHHVDHIVPLRSKLVCGLHVEHNLQPLPLRANARKGNRIWPDMPEQARV